MKIKNADLFRLQAGLRGVADLRGVKFAYACTKNLRRVAALCDDMRAGLKPTPAFAAYEKARMALAKKHATKDENGETIAETVGAETRYQIAFPLLFEAELDSLTAEHAGAVAAHADAVAEFEALLLESSDVDIYTIAIELVPDDISAGQLEMIWEMIAE